MTTRQSSPRRHRLRRRRRLPPAPIFGTVAGTVSVEGSGLAEVSVNLLGAASQSATTGSSGGYSFSNVPAGTHGVQISGAPAEVAFVSTATVVTITTSGQTATADFSGNYIRTSSISGTVLTAGGEGVVATVTATGKAMLMDEEPAAGTSNTDGDFTLSGLRAGGYTVTIADFGDHEFTITSREVTVGVGLSALVAFAAEAVPETTGSITGQVVTAAGVGIVATVTAVGTGEDGVTVAGSSDIEGDYELPEVEAGDYTVTISDFGDHEFAVSSRGVTVVAGQSVNASFAAEAVPEPEVTTGSITGQVVTAAGVGIVATVTAVGTGEDAVTVAGSSDTEGDYELPVEAGDYTVTISDFGDHEFAVSSRDVTVVAGQSVNASFAAEAVPEPEVTTGSITGQVVTAAGVGIVATVTAVGTGEDAVTVAGSSDTEGDYELPGVEAGDYTVTISDFGDHEFAVSSRDVTVVAGQSVNASFAAEAVVADPPEPEATTGSITGQVVTATRVGIVATVTAVGTGEDGVTVAGNSDIDGDYELPEVEAGDYTVTISDFGDHEFTDTSRDVTVVAGQSVNASFVAEAETQAGFILITDVISDSDDGTYSGQLTALIDVERERGDARLEKITLYVNSDPVNSLSFGFAAAPAEDPALAAQQVVFRLSFDSDEYDPETGDVAYLNGAHDIVAGLTVQGSTEEVFSNQFVAEFDNEDGVHVAVSGQTRRPMIGQDGGYWYGGPGAGFNLTARPVMYSGSTVTSVTLREGFCVGNDAKAVAAAPYDFTPDCGGHEGRVEPNSFSIGAAAVQTRNAEDEVFSIQLDYAGPGAPFFMPNPNDRQEGWINDAVGLVAKHDSKKNDDGWLIYGATGGGVGGYTVQLQVGEDLEEALAATASSSPTLPAASKKNDAYCFVASAVDALGNRSDLPDEEDDDCAAPGDYMDAVAEVEGMGDEGDEDYVAPVDAEDAVVFSSITAGVDTEAPTLEFTGASAGAGDDPDRAATLESEFELQVKDNDDGSGVHGADPVLATLSIRNADGAECRELADLGEEDKKCTATFDGLIEALPLVRTDGVSGLTDTGYYEFTALAQDKAGNQSAEMSEVALYDNVAPEVQLSTTRSTDFAEDFTLNKVLVATDDLSLRDYTVNLVATGLNLGTDIPIDFAMGSNTWDDYNAPDPLTRDDVVRGPVALPFIAVQASVTADPSVIASLKVDVRDQVEGRTDAVSDMDETGITVGDDDGFAATNFDRTNVKAFALSHNGGAAAATDEGIDDSKSSIKLTATAVVVGKIQTVTVTQTDADGEEGDPDVTITNVTADDPALGTTTVTSPDPVVEDQAFTTTVTTISTLPNPFSSVNFYATDDGGDMLDESTQLRWITSVSAARADVETVTEANEPDGSAVGDRVWTYEITVSADDYYAMVGGDEEYRGSILAIGVNENDKGVALASEAEVLNFEER